MGKKVHVPAYHRSDGTPVRAYTRYDPRSKHYGEQGELPPENQTPSFLSDGIEEEESTEESEESKEESKGRSKKGKGSFDDSD
jgi:hypothetical protein